MGRELPLLYAILRFVLSGGGLWLILLVWSRPDSYKLWRLLLAAVPLSVCIWTQIEFGQGTLQILTLNYALMVMGGVFLGAGELVLLTIAIFSLQFWGVWRSYIDISLISMDLANISATLSAGWLAKGLVTLYRQGLITQNKLIYQHEHDDLTGLYNRDHAIKEISKLINKGQRFSIVMADLHNYRAINQHFGPEIGDAILQQFITFCQSELPMEWLIARYGADELILVLPNEEEAMTWVSFLRKAQAGLYYELADNKLPIYAAFGWAKYPEDGVNFHELVKTAEFRRLQQLTQTTLREKDLGDLSSDLRWALIETLSSKDVYTRIHSEWVATYLLHFAAYKEIEVEEKQIWRAGLLHDIGKLAIPDRILKKPGKLALEEYELMKQHPMLGNDLIQRWSEESLEVNACIIEHHERWDGRGYPFGKRGIEISLIGRMIAIVDAYSAMTLDRTYHRGRTQEQALLEIKKGAGSQFDPILATEFIAMISSLGKSDTAVCG